MPATYEPIATTTLGSAQTSVTFSSIPATYTDIIAITNYKAVGTITSEDSFVRLNSDSGTNYSTTRIFGNGSSVFSSRVTNRTFIDTYIDDSADFVMLRFQFMNYSNTTTYKTILTRQDYAAQSTSATVSLWRNTAAINSITFTAPDNNGGGTPDQFATGSTFTLYGIKAA
jgi:hypothetical protein